jgi:hypothetical protein
MIRKNMNKLHFDDLLRLNELIPFSLHEDRVILELSSVDKNFLKFKIQNFN